MKFNKIILLAFFIFVIPSFVSAYSIAYGSTVYPITIGGVSYSVDFGGMTPDIHTCDFWVAVGSSYVHTNQREPVFDATAGTYNLATLPLVFTLNSCDTTNRVATFTLTQSSGSSCSSVWSCGSWSSCSNGIQTRSCSDGCGSSKTETTQCTMQQTCQNECTNGGVRTCYSDSSWRECNNYDSDSCLEYSSVNQCPSTYRCTSGECFPTQNLCNPGYVCDGSKVYWQNADCGKTYQRDCTADNPYFTCSNGQCVSKCKSNSYIDCWNGNVYWFNDCNQPEIEIKHCSLGTTCDKNKQDCVQSCQSRYSKKCYYDDIYWFDSCSNPEVIAEDCGSQGCSIDKCVEKTSTTESFSTSTSCTNECSQQGKKECFGNGFKFCSNYDTDSCLEWGDLQTCSSGQTCSEGSCKVTSEQSVSQINEETAQQKCNFFTKLFGCKEESEQEKTKQIETTSSSLNTKKYSAKYPIIFVHGWNGNLETFKDMQDKLDAEGIVEDKGDIYSTSSTSICPNKWSESISVNFEYYDTGYDKGVYYYADKLASAIDTLRECTNSPKITILAHSMGGLISRVYMQEYGSDAINKLIMLETPNYGAPLSIFGFVDQSPLASEIGNDVRSMNPGSILLKNLNSNTNECPYRKKMINIASKNFAENLFDENIKIESTKDVCFDLGKIPLMSFIVPVLSTELKNAKNILISGCTHSSITSPNKCLESYDKLKMYLN